MKSRKPIGHKGAKARIRYVFDGIGFWAKHRKKFRLGFGNLIIKNYVALLKDHISKSQV